MLLDLKNLFDHEGGQIPFETDLDLRQMQFGGGYPVQEPVHMAGKVQNTAGVYVLDAEVSTNLHCVCDRCTTPFERIVRYPVHAVLTRDQDTEDQEDFWVFPLDQERVDLDEIANTAFVLNMDSKFVCKESCKGLCPRCGANLNDGPCGCKKEIDPRLAVLAQLLEKQS